MARLSHKLLHPLCIIGAAIGVTGLAASIVGLVIDINAEEHNAYQGLLTIVLFPSVCIFGLSLLVFGLWLERRRAKKLEREGQEWRPRLDPAEKRYRRLLMVMAGFCVIFLLFSVVAAYHAFEFTETTSFCGELCHTPMEPQFTAHQFSPHSSVDCTGCHVGPGVTGYVEAKLSGVRQLLQMFGPSYPQPIRAGHDKLLVVGQSCSKCHRPDKYWGPKLDSQIRFGYDLQNSRRDLSLLMKPAVMAKDNLRPAGEGLHWHMRFENIWFRAVDERRQQIPWVKVERADGTIVVFEDKDLAAQTDEELLPEQRMGCIDCHSRPAHKFVSPNTSVNRAMQSGRIDPSVPSIKKVTVAALTQKYETAEEAHKRIREYIETFYRKNFGGVVLKRKESLENAIAATQTIQKRNAFPTMRVRWSTHPDNSSHREFPGCFRCHAGKHVSANGQKIASACDTCHVFYEKSRTDESLTQIPADGSTFHSISQEHHRNIGCWTCHSGTVSPYNECKTCHEKAVGSHGMKFECSICHKPGQEKVTTANCRPCHPAGESALHSHKDHGDCLVCHETHGWKTAATSCSTGACHPGEDESYHRANLEGFKGIRSHMSGLPR